MGVLAPLRGLLRARKRRPEQVAYWVSLAHERFGPADLPREGIEAEEAGFDGICCSDHLAPWWTRATAPTSSGNAWVWLGAAAHATHRAPLGPPGAPLVHPPTPRRAAPRSARLCPPSPTAPPRSSWRSRWRRWRRSRPAAPSSASAPARR